MIKNMLELSDSYAFFQKYPTDLLAQYFKNLFVPIRYNPIAEISNYVNVPSLKNHRLATKLDIKDKPSNVHLYPTPVYYLPSNAGYKKLGEKYYNEVSKLIKKKALQFDIIHAHFLWSNGYVGAKLKEKYDTPFVVTGHGFDVYDLPFRDGEWKSKIEYVLNSADSIITVSNKNLELIKKLDVKTPVTVIPNGFKEELFHPMDQETCRKKLRLPLDKKILLSVGYLEAVKGHKYLIEAMQIVSCSRKDILCIIVGSGKLEAKLKNQINKAGLSDYVKLIGAKSHSEVPIWMNGCDVFVLPSLNEGNPTVLPECLGCGKPFVGTRVGGVPEIIKSENYGLLSDPENSEALACNIIRALEKEWDAEKIIKYASQFTWKNIAKQKLKILKICGRG